MNSKFFSDGAKKGLRNYGGRFANEIGGVDTSMALEYEKSEEAQNVYRNVGDLSKVSNPEGVDEVKWKRAKEISQETYGQHRWPFIMWLAKEKL